MEHKQKRHVNHDSNLREVKDIIFLIQWLLIFFSLNLVQALAYICECSLLETHLLFPA